MAADRGRILRAWFEARLGSVREAVRAGSLEGSVPIEEIVPDWPGRLHRR
jgi:hypothetical protein